MNKQSFIPVLPLLVLLLTSCATSTSNKPTPAHTYLNEYSTQERVDFVLQCIEQNGGLQYETLYPCICRIDAIASQMSFKDYEGAQVFTSMRRTPGEKGGVFRDPQHGKQLRKKLKDTIAFAEKSCPITIIKR